LIDDGWKMKGDAVDILMFKKGINDALSGWVIQGRIQPTILSRV